MQDYIPILVSLGVVFVLSWQFFRLWILQDYEVRHRAVQFLFALVMSTSFSMFLLVIFEILNILKPETRYYNWLFNLYTEIIVLVVVNPGYFLWLVLSNFPLTRNRASTFTSLGMLCWLWFFLSFGKDGYISVPVHVNESKGFFQIATDDVIARVGILGVALCACLSGFGAVNNPYTWLSFFLTKIRDKDVAHARCITLDSLGMVTDLKKRILMIEHKLHRNSIPVAEAFQSKGLFQRAWAAVTDVVGSMHQTHRIQKKLHDLESQLEGAIELHSSLFEEYTKLREVQISRKMSQTLRGRTKNFLGHFMAVYCVWKIFISIVNLVFRRDRKQDPISQAFDIVFKFVDLDIDVDFWSQQLSFCMIGVLCATQIRGMLTRCMDVLHFTNLKGIFSSHVISLILIEVMGAYFVAYILLMRMNLPAEYRAIVTKVLGDLEFNFYYRWFDFIFLFSSLFTICSFSLAWMKDKIFNTSINKSEKYNKC